MAIDFGGNKLTGTIPLELADLGSLRTINLARNELHGPLPAWLGDKPMLEHAMLDGNMLSGREVSIETTSQRLFVAVNLTADAVVGLCCV